MRMFFPRVMLVRITRISTVTMHTVTVHHSVGSVCGTGRQADEDGRHHHERRHRITSGRVSNGTTTFRCCAKGCHGERHERERRPEECGLQHRREAMERRS